MCRDRWPILLERGSVGRLLHLSGTNFFTWPMHNCAENPFQLLDTCILEVEQSLWLWVKCKILESHWQTMTKCVCLLSEPCLLHVERASCQACVFPSQWSADLDGQASYKYQASCRITVPGNTLLTPCLRDWVPQLRLMMSLQSLLWRQWV